MRIIFFIGFVNIVSAGLGVVFKLPLKIVDKIVNSPNESPPYVNASVIIESEGYPFEIHTVITTDGYILTLHRIPRGKYGETNGKVAYLQHGILSSSADWLISGSGKALAYILADAGYDVWMGNARGNTQSRKHLSLNPDRNFKFWSFSWHEIGTIDIPQMIDYVLYYTGANSVYYVGHSQGTTTFFVMTSMLPEYNQKIKVGVSLAPIGYMKHLTSPLMRLMGFWHMSISILLQLIGAHEFLPQNEFLSLLSKTVCRETALTQVLCTNALFAICGFSVQQMNATLLPAIMRYTPAGASTRQFVHYAQELNSGKFRQLDYGPIKNRRKYGANEPPDYPLHQISTPVHMIYSLNDWLAAEVDVRRLCSEIRSCQELYLVPDQSFNHLDFLFGIDAPALVYSKVLQIFSSY